MTPLSVGHGHNVREVTSSHEHPTQAPDMLGHMVMSKSARVRPPQRGRGRLLETLCLTACYHGT